MRSMCCDGRYFRATYYRELMRYNVLMIKKVLTLAAFFILICGFYGALKPLPSGLSFRGTAHPVSSEHIEFFSDRTYVDDSGNRHSDQHIFNEVFRMIDGAQSYILIDMFFFSDFLGTATTSHRALSGELMRALITKKQQRPDITIQVITDPINTVYGGYQPPQFDELRAAGISVIITDLSPLRDSNPVWSALWRSGVHLLPNTWFAHSIPNVFDVQKPHVSLRAALATLNFKANHRKVILTDYSRAGVPGLATLITSANPHDGSGAHSNTAVWIDSGPFGEDVIASERAVARLSKTLFVEPTPTLIGLPENTDGTASATLLTEGEIKKAVLETVATLTEGDTLDMAMFYLSNRAIIRAIKAADARGVTIRLLLDPNKDAFGREKNGTPNRFVAYELMKKAEHTTIRWCDTHGEQCHNKLVLATHESETTLILGSANFTRRNLDDLNLETSVMISSKADVPVIGDASRFFTAVWNNETGKHHSTPYATYAEKSVLKTIWYRFGEATGISHY